MGRKTKDFAIIGAVALAVILLLAYGLETFTDFPITTYNIMFFIMVPVAFFLVLRFLKYARNIYDLKFEDALLLGAVAFVVVMFFTMGKSIWPTFSTTKVVETMASIIGM
jgi:hypothetical protein